MTVWNILYSILIKPLELLFETIFSFVYGITANPGMTIIFLSLAMNLLVLPLYMRADAMQEEERLTTERLSKGVDHIKKTFSGDERMMMLQTYYRQNNYKPTYVLRSATSLFLEIPFFIAAYNFLSSLVLLENRPFGPIADLGQPDALLTVGGITINLLPVIMTLVNIISSAIFTKGHPLKTKIQLYGMALFFLVFLYRSPAGLVFYWTLNNVFSLVKTIFYKLKHSKQILTALASITGIGCLAACAIVDSLSATKMRVFICVAAGVLLQIPAVIAILKSRGRLSKEISFREPDRKLFIIAALFMTVFTGILIPSAVVGASPSDFINIYQFYSPLWYVVSAGCMAAGTFLVWFGVFYWLASPKVKVILEYVMGCGCAVSALDYMAFNRNFGNLNKILYYDESMGFPTALKLINLLSVVFLAAAMVFVGRKWKKVFGSILFAGCAAIIVMSALNISGAASEIKNVEERNENIDRNIELTLSRTGQNVVVLMLDRAYGEFVPYILDERPELVEKFDGFTYYDNTLCFGLTTLYASAPLFGGYEYTPEEMNRRDDVKMVDKQNEALKLMPTLFSKEGYDVTVCDPPYANYQWIPDLSVFDDIENVRAFNTMGALYIKSGSDPVELNLRNFFCFGLMKSAPLVIQPSLYDYGGYHNANKSPASKYFSFLESYSVLDSLPELTRLSDNASGGFLMMDNNITHEETMLQKPDYTPSVAVDNSQYDAENPHSYVIDGKELAMENDTQVKHYYVNMAAFLKLAEWFDYLRENDVYDNTRIILVADHADATGQLDDFIVHFDDGSTFDAERFFPLLMVKDFNAHGFTASNEFMTNADVPTLATQGVIENPLNPFTGNEINSDEKTAHDQHIVVDWEKPIDGNVEVSTFSPGTWIGVHDDIRNPENWSHAGTGTLLPETDESE